MAKTRAQRPRRKPPAKARRRPSAKRRDRRDGVARRLFGLLVAGLVLAAVYQAAAGWFSLRRAEAVTFDARRGTLFLPLAEAAHALRWQLQEQGAQVWLNGREVSAAQLVRLPDGAALVSLEGLAEAGAEVERETAADAALVSAEGRRLRLEKAPQRVEVSLADQRLLAWQGSRLILASKVSTGRRNSTPPGEFKAGPYKARQHFSKLYNNAPMPWSVQVNGHIFIHGFTQVPDYPASHGCIRLPLTGANPARFFYEWVERGTPVRILRESLPVSPVPAVRL